jgi:signal recognition particle GTPase
MNLNNRIKKLEERANPQSEEDQRRQRMARAAGMSLQDYEDFLQRVEKMSDEEVREWSERLKQEGFTLSDARKALGYAEVMPIRKLTRANRKNRTSAP